MFGVLWLWVLMCGVWWAWGVCACAFVCDAWVLMCECHVRCVGVWVCMVVWLCGYVI